MEGRTKDPDNKIDKVIGMKTFFFINKHPLFWYIINYDGSVFITFFRRIGIFCLFI